MHGWLVTGWWLLQATPVVWILAEIALQVRQYRQGGKATVTEWGSLAVIVLSIVVGNVLARLAVRGLPSLGLGIPFGTLLAIALPLAWAWCTYRPTTRSSSTGRTGCSATRPTPVHCWP
jgi:hypothetical protein